MQSCIDSSPLLLHRNLTSAVLSPVQRDGYAHVVYIVPLLIESPILVL